MMFIKQISVAGFLALVVLGLGLSTPTQETQASCTQVVREDLWYSGTGTVILNERLPDPYDCAEEARLYGTPYWNESLTYRPWEEDPYETICFIITNPTGDISKPPYSPALDHAGQPVETTYRSGNTCPAETVSASLVANPNSIIRGEQSLLTWTSTGATTCTGSGFSTGGATAGSVSVSPQQTTNYTVTCTGLGGQATAAAQVTVADGSLQVSCRAHPGQAGIGEDVLWSSTVTGPEGTYTYSWSGTEGLSGTLSQIFKQYQTTGSKTGSLTVTLTSASGSASAGQCQNAQSTVANITQASHCSGGTVVYQTGDTIDGATLANANWEQILRDAVASEVLPASACAELSVRSGTPSAGSGYSPNSQWQLKVYAGGSVVSGNAGVYTGSACTQGSGSYDYQCGSIAGSIVSCSTTTGSGSTVTQTKTVACENSVSIISGGGGGGGGSQCSDGIDNDGDGNVDLADQGCSGSGDDSEATASTASQCSDGIDNNGDGNADFPEDPGCSSLSDNLELLEPGSLTLTATPPLIKKNQSCTLTLSAVHVTSCSLTGSGVSRSYTAQNGVISLKEVVTPALAQTSTYTLSCNGLDGKTVTKSVDCKIAPTFQEF